MRRRSLQPTKTLIGEDPRSADAMPQNQPSGKTASPSQGRDYEQISHNLHGRMEKRLPIIIVVRLSRVPHSPPHEEERTYTDNLSPHGARVFSRFGWRPGEKAQVVTLKEEYTMRGDVIYCQRLDHDRFCIGLKFVERPITWSTLCRYYGM